MRPLGIVKGQVLLHLFQCFVEPPATRDAKVLRKQDSVKPFHEPVALRPADRGGAVLDLLRSQKQLMGVSIRRVAKISARSGEHGVDPGLMPREEGQDA